MAKQIKVGVVGCGYWGPNLMRNFRTLPECQLKMMCDLSEQRLKHLSRSTPRSKETDFCHMLNGAGLDAVVIATAVKGALLRWPRPACWPASTRSSRSRWPAPPQNARN